jgi:hypothetical protein
MSDTIKTGTVLIKEGTLLPEALRFESESCVPGWRLVTDLDGYALDREIQKTGWTFFCLAGEIKATVFGIDAQSMVHRAIERILANPKSERFNSLEITRVTSKGSGRFPGVRFVTVSANLRHIQESLFLLCAKDVEELGPDRIESRLNQGMEFATRKGQPDKTLRQPNVATALNL